MLRKKRRKAKAIIDKMEIGFDQFEK